jgi:hypothetical protein
MCIARRAADRTSRPFYWFTVSIKKNLQIPFKDLSIHMNRQRKATLLYCIYLISNTYRVDLYLKSLKCILRVDCEYPAENEKCKKLAIQHWFSVLALIEGADIGSDTDVRDRNEYEYFENI